MVVRSWILFVTLALAAPAMAEGDKQEPRPAKEPEKSEAKAAPQKAEAQKKVSVFQQASRKKKSEDVYVFTNEDLAARARPEDEPTEEERYAPPPPDLRPKLPDPIEYVEGQEERVVETRQMTASAQAELAAAQARLAALEKQLLATVNPFSARPQLSEEEKEIRADSGETAAQRNERTKVLVDEARQEVAAAEAKLKRIQRRR